MGEKTLDFGRDPLPGSGVYEVREIAPRGQRGRLLGTVKAKTVEEASRKAARLVLAGTEFTVTEIPAKKK